MKIGQKLILGFLTIIVLMAIMGGLNIINIKNIASEAEKHHSLCEPVRHGIAHIIISIERIVRATEEFDAGWTTRKEAVEVIEENKGHIKEHLKQMLTATAAGLSTPEEVRYLKGAINRLYGLSAKLFSLHGKSREQRSSTMKEFAEKVEEINEKLAVIFARTNEISVVSLNVIKDTITSSRKITIYVFAGVVFIILGTAFLISRNILYPIAELKKAVFEIGKGNLDSKIKINSKDEIGDFAACLRQMTEDLKHLTRAKEEAERSKVAELEKAYKELKSTQGMLIQAEKMTAVGHLAGGMAHEVKNPLQIIIQGVNYLQRAIAPEQESQFEVLNMIKSAVERSDKIIRGVLNFSRTAPVELISCRIDKIIEISLDLIKKELFLNNIRINKDYPYELPLVMADVNQMEQAFINIMLNSMRAMAGGGEIIIRLSIKKFTQLVPVIGRRATDLFKLGKTALLCEIEDTGTGIPKDKLNNVFDPFFTTAAVGEGTGLGLTITQSIIEKHGGLINIESEEGKGTKVIITLPVIKGPAC